MEEKELVGGQIPPPSWPSSGFIKVNNLSVRYATDLPDVLHGITFDIEAGTRVGLVGTTGSGKSTLTATLFRALEANEGTIEIDGMGRSTKSLFRNPLKRPRYRECRSSGATKTVEHGPPR